MIKKIFAATDMTKGLRMLSVLITCFAMHGASYTQGLVNIVPIPQIINVDEGDNFTVVIQLQPVNGGQLTVADIVMSFDPSKLQVNSAVLSPGTLLPFSTIPTNIDNVNGIFYLGGFGFSPASTTFDHAVVEFSTIALGTTAVAHVLEGVPATGLAFAGESVLGTAESIQVTINGNGQPDCEGVFGGSAIPGSPCATGSNTPGIYAADCTCEALPCNAQGGTLEAPANRSFCVGTGSPAFISVAANGAVGTNQRWGLIDSNGNVVATRGNNSLFNLDSYPPGDYSIRYIRFENDVTNIAEITNINQINTLVGCYGLAGNAINLFLRNEPQGGVLSPLTSTSVCANAGAASAVEVTVTGNSGQFSRFGITSPAQGQEIIASNTSGVFNLNGLAPGNYNIGHISYEQGVNLAGISFPNELQGCYDLSNSISVTILSCAPSSLAALPNPTAGFSAVSFTVPETGPAALEVYDMSGRLLHSVFNATAEGGIEYRYDFDGSHLPNGIYIYRLTTGKEVRIEKMMIAK